MNKNSYHSMGWREMTMTFLLVTWSLALAYPQNLVAEDTPFLGPTANFSSNRMFLKKRPSKHSIELRLKYDSEQKKIVVLKMRLRNIPAPKNRLAHPDDEQLVIEYENQSGMLLGFVPIQDPTVLYADWLAQTDVLEPDLLTGETIHVPESEFMVVIPYDKELAQVKLKRRLRSAGGSIDATDSIQEELLGAASVDQDAIQSYADQIE